MLNFADRLGEYQFTITQRLTYEIIKFIFSIDIVSNTFEYRGKEES